MYILEQGAPSGVPLRLLDLIARFYFLRSSQKARIAGFADGGYTEPTFATAKRNAQ